MGAIIFIVLLLMIPIGLFQVISAIVILITTKRPYMKEHFTYYLIGVVGYFGILFPLWHTIDLIGFGYFASFFFLGALGLMVYHITIFFKKETYRAPKFQV